MAVYLVVSIITSGSGCTLDPLLRVVQRDGHLGAGDHRTLDFLRLLHGPWRPVWRRISSRPAVRCGHERRRRPAHDQVRSVVSMISHHAVQRGDGIVLDPLRKTTRSLVLMAPWNSYPSADSRSVALVQSALIVAPHLSRWWRSRLVCFGFATPASMRQEVRST